jgi:hypothetical protein
MKITRQLIHHAYFFIFRTYRIPEFNENQLVDQTYQQAFSMVVYKDNHNMQMDFYHAHDRKLH